MRAAEIYASWTEAVPAGKFGDEPELRHLRKISCSSGCFFWSRSRADSQFVVGYCQRSCGTKRFDFVLDLNSVWVGSNECRKVQLRQRRYLTLAKQTRMTHPASRNSDLLVRCTKSGYRNILVKNTAPHGERTDVSQGDHKIELIFIINGANFPLEANLNSPLKEAVSKALSESGNSGRPATEWQVRDGNGVLLETERKIGDFGFANGTRLFLSLAVGAGGTFQS